MLHPRPRCPPVRRCCGLGSRPRPCARPAGSWRFVKIFFSKCSASLRVKVALYTRGFHFSRFRGKRNKGRQVAGSHHPGRLSHGYRCDNVTLIGRLAPLTHGACAKAQGRAQASVTPWVALGEATAHTLPRKDVGEATRREPPALCRVSRGSFLSSVFAAEYCLESLCSYLPCEGGMGVQVVSFSSVSSTFGSTHWILFCSPVLQMWSRSAVRIE
jgi:hypothetical protein